MKNIACISIFLTSILMGSVLLFSISSVKTYMETIELAENGESNNQNTLNILEEEQHIFGISCEKNALLNKKVLYFIFDIPILSNVFDVLTRPPLQ